MLPTDPHPHIPLAPSLTHPAAAQGRIPSYHLTLTLTSPSCRLVPYGTRAVLPGTLTLASSSQCCLTHPGTPAASPGIIALTSPSNCFAHSGTHTASTHSSSPPASTHPCKHASTTACEQVPSLSWCHSHAEQSAQPPCPAQHAREAYHTHMCTQRPSLSQPAQRPVPGAMPAAAYRMQHPPIQTDTMVDACGMTRAPVAAQYPHPHVPISTPLALFHHPHMHTQCPPIPTDMMLAPTPSHPSRDDAKYPVRRCHCLPINPAVPQRSACSSPPSSPHAPHL